MSKRFECHCHTEKSNIRFWDSTNRLDEVVKRAIDIGLAGIAITDHECVSQTPDIFALQEKVSKTNPDFKIAIGNEIYLVNDRKKNQPYYHFILIAKDEEGHRLLRELSSRAWMQSYYDRGLERVPTLYSEVEEIVGPHKGHLIATTACLAGRLSQKTLEMLKARFFNKDAEALAAYNDINDFLKWCVDMFGDDFYIETAPSKNPDQIKVNKMFLNISRARNIKLVCNTDAHYLSADDREIHSAFLKAKQAERETDAFYHYSYLQTEEEMVENLAPSLDKEIYEEMCRNSMEIYDKIKLYDLRRPQQVPEVPLPVVPKQDRKDLDKYPVLKSLFSSDDNIERVWVNRCFEQLDKRGISKEDLPEYIAELEYEADIKKEVGKKLGTSMFNYPLTLQYYINMMWDCGSCVGVGRGSSVAGLNHYLLGITQLDPVKNHLKMFWRYANKERIELADIDEDLSASKKDLVVQEIKKERGARFAPGIDELSRKNLGCVLVATWGTLGTRAAIQAACRGYITKDTPNGVDKDVALYLTSLVPVERGFSWTLKDITEGNEEKNRKPIKAFIDTINEYPDLLKIAKGIEGLCVQRSSHASGVIFNDADPYDKLSYIRTPKGEVITAYDLHGCESLGATKYDFLVTDAMDKIGTTLRLLQEAGKIEKDLTLRQAYDKYIGMDAIDMNDPEVWCHIKDNDVLSLFQFDSTSGSQGIAMVQPDNLEELATTNGLIRLAAEPGMERPLDKYVRYKKDPSLWEQEMTKYGLTEEEKKAVRPYFKEGIGQLISQENLMLTLMDKGICGYSIKEANTVRKVVGKKQIDKIPAVHAEILARAKSKNLANYIWDNGVRPQLSYSFSKLHATVYSAIAYQSAYLATKWSPIYWDTACLIVNSGALEADSEDGDGEEERGGASINYGKLATAIGEINKAGVRLVPPDINTADWQFVPDEKNNQIIYSFKALRGVGDHEINEILASRPFTSFQDYLNRTTIKKPATVALIKAGVFDSIENQSRVDIMKSYIDSISDKKTTLNMRNFQAIIGKGLCGPEIDFQRRLFNFFKYIKQKQFRIDTDTAICDEKAQNFLQNSLPQGYDLMQVTDNGCVINLKDFKKIYDKQMLPAKQWVADNKEELLREFNKDQFDQLWNKYCSGSVSKWEMDSMSYYWHQHELANVDKDKYLISDFDQLPEKPEVERFFQIHGHNIPIYKIHKIIGTCIAKNNISKTFTLLVPDGSVVNIRLSDEHYAYYNKQISEIMPDGTKKVREKSWFTHGNKLMVVGFRRGRQFVPKKYKNTPVPHRLFLITDINGTDIEYTSRRYGQDDDSDL